MKRSESEYEEMSRAVEAGRYTLPPLGDDDVLVDALETALDRIRDARFRRWLGAIDEEILSGKAASEMIT